MLAKRCLIAGLYRHSDNVPERAVLAAATPLSMNNIKRHKYLVHNFFHINFMRHVNLFWCEFLI